jgi:hypothetical protein
MIWRCSEKRSKPTDPATGLARWGAITLFKAKFRAEKNQELN